MIGYTQAEELMGGYKLAELKAAEINEFYTEISRLLNCAPQNIAFAYNATDAYAKVLSSIPFSKNDVIITTHDDYVSNQINFISLKERFGIEVVRIKTDASGDLDMDDFKNLVNTYYPKLVAVTHIPTNSGLIQNVEEVGAICEANNIMYLVDACQSVGQIQVDVNKIKCDFLTATGRKFLRGPRGTGFLYVSDKILNKNFAPLYIDLRGATWIDTDTYKMIDSAKRFETWELPYAQLVGLTEAVRYANQVGIEEIQSYNQKLNSSLRNNLAHLKGVHLHDRGRRTGSLITFTKDGLSLETITNKLDANRVFYTVSQKNSALLDYREKQLEWTIRLSPHYFNTLEEADQLTQIIDSL